MHSDKHNEITTKAMDLIFLSRQVPFGIPQHVQCTHHGLTHALLCVPFLFADSPSCQFAVVWWLPYICKQESSVFSVVTGLIAEALLLLFFIYNVVKWAEHTVAECEVNNCRTIINITTTQAT